MDKDSAKFGVFHDIPKASDIKIHTSKCSFYKIHDPSAYSTDWYYFGDLQSAIQKASELARKYNMNYRDCKFCKPSTL